MRKIYNITDANVVCPSCGKVLENANTPITDFIVMAPAGQPIKLNQASTSEDMCGWCDAEYSATRISETQVEVKSKY